VSAQHKVPTWTHLTEEALRTADDFLSADQLRTLTGASQNQLSAALFHLQKRRVVDAVSGPSGLFWFYRGEDTRLYQHEERTPEAHPRRRGAKRRDA
jgi:hypothetical protein